jgi:hypothetical protein
MQFNFNFGKKKPTIVQYAIIGSVLSVIITSFAACTKLPESRIWDLLDEIQRALHINILNDFIINDPEKLDRRIKRDVDRAIRDVTKEYDRIISESDRKYKPQYLEEKNDESLCYSEDCKQLTPPMRICSPVFEGTDCYLKSEDK